MQAIITHDSARESGGSGLMVVSTLVGDTKCSIKVFCHLNLQLPPLCLFCKFAECMNVYNPTPADEP
jgi:hypothetical protein